MRSKGLWKKVEKLKGGVSRGPEVQRKKFRRPEEGVFFSGFLGRMVRGAGGERVRMVEGEGGQYVKPVL